MATDDPPLQFIVHEDGGLTVPTGGALGPEPARQLALAVLGYGDLSEEEILTDLLAENPFVEDRIDVLINCLMLALDPNSVLPDHRVVQFGKEILAVMERATAWFPKGEAN